MTLQLHRPDGKGSLVPSPPRSGRSEDWRKSLKSYRWRAGALRNSEMNPTPTTVAVLFWAALAGATFALLLWGYGSHFWH